MVKKGQDASFNGVVVASLGHLIAKRGRVEVGLPTNRTVLRRKELKLQPPAFMLPSVLLRPFIFDCKQYTMPSPTMICQAKQQRQTPDPSFHPAYLGLSLYIYLKMDFNSQNSPVSNQEFGGPMDALNPMLAI